MDDKTKDKSSDNKAISPFAMDKTYGEKKYDFIVGNLINFWLNLGSSGLFTYWVSHSKNPIKLPFTKKEFAPPSEVLRQITGWFEKTPLLKQLLSDKALIEGRASPRNKMANILSGVLTLTFVGHVSLIPPTWLGAKIRPAYIRKEDRKHYGDEAMQSDDLKARHAAIDAEERPTLLGAVVGRFGSVFATQFTGLTIGSDSNLLQWIGEKTPLKFLRKFPGIDHIVGIAGEKLGAVPEELSSGMTGKLDRAISNYGKKDGKGGYGYSSLQLAKDQSLANQEYKHFTQHVSKYWAQDVLYTIVTSTTIGPVINTLKKFIPGLTYKPKVSIETAALAASVPTHLTTAQATAADDQRAASKETANNPSIKVSNVNHDETLVARDEQQLAPQAG